MNPQEVRAGFIGDIDRADTDGASERLGKEKSMSLTVVRGPGVGLLRTGVWCTCPFRHPGIC